MRKTLFSIIVVILLTPAMAGAQEVSKAYWIEAMQTALPTALCKSQQYFRQCFDISAVECEETAASATRICIGKVKNEIPEMLQQPNDGMRWGAKIGQCAGESFELVLIKKWKNTERCNNIENWK